MTFYPAADMDLARLFDELRQQTRHMGDSYTTSLAWDYMALPAGYGRVLQGGLVFTPGDLDRIKYHSMLVNAALKTGGDFDLVAGIGVPVSLTETALAAAKPYSGSDVTTLAFEAGQVPDDWPGAVFRVRDLDVEVLFGEPQEGAEPAGEAGGGSIQVTPLDSWGAGYAEVRPSEELLAALPASARPYAVRTLPVPTNGNTWFFSVEEGEFKSVQTTTGCGVTGQELITQARTAYRELVRQRLGSPYRDQLQEERQKQEEHRRKTAANFEAFVRNREHDTEHHIGKLPFVPHGLAASRRWGIEVESGGARGVQTPEDWDSKGDGSLRSAYDGYVEVQDFEAYEEERTENVNWPFCENAERHNPRNEVYDSGRGEYIYTINEEYLDPRECDNCGQVTRTVLVEPQTIRHHAQSGDCREFVSPILVSMHSRGLQSITEALSKNPQNDSAGVHVHVESSDLSKQQIATMVYGYDILEPILESSYRRNRRDFCERRGAEEVLDAARKSKGEGYNPQSGRRYSTLNTHSLSTHGTLEFRAMGPVYEYDYLIRWAMLCRELVNSVANGATTKDFAKIKSWDDLVMFIAKFGKEYVRAAVYELTGEVGEQAKLEKAGEPITNEALNADLRTLLNPEALSGVAENLSAMAQALTGLRLNPDLIEQRSNQLVSVGGHDEI